MKKITLKFENLRFSEKNEKENKIRVSFMNIYYFYLDKKDLLEIGNYKINQTNNNEIEFSSEKKEANINQKFSFLLDKGFKELMSSINNKPALYIHKNSGIPLIGSNEFGIIDRKTNTIEIKPLTTCNIDCIFCSVDHTKRSSDIIVEADYLVEELNKVIEIKKNNVNIHIGSQGDPSLYADLEYLVKKIRENKKVRAISMVTNGILITKERAERLIKAGLSHFHFSIHSLDEKKASYLANSFYPVKKVMNVAEFVAKNAHCLIVPVYVPGINDNDLEDIILFAKKINADIGIQNFLEYDFGKKPVKSISFDEFYKKLKEIEQKIKKEKNIDIDLTKITSDLTILQDNTLKKPFKKNDIIEVELKAKDRLKNSVIGVSKNRVITVINCTKTQGKIKVKLIRDKDNVFVGVLI
ncbi:MAG: radical SAM protein [Candidatus Woesearchaeota archaeon]